MSFARKAGACYAVGGAGTNSSSQPANAARSLPQRPASTCLELHCSVRQRVQDALGVSSLDKLGVLFRLRFELCLRHKLAKMDALGEGLQGRGEGQGQGKMSTAYSSMVSS